jgi:enolase-phosphatase E1
MIGPKTEVASYQKIVRSIGCEASEILFLSDIKAELDAAHGAGLQTLWLVRDREPTIAAAHSQVNNFSAITLP